MLRLPTNSRTPSFPWQCFAWSLLCAALFVASNQQKAQAQGSSVLSLPEASAPEPEAKRPLGEWRANVKNRLTVVKNLLQENEDARPPAGLKRRSELLSQIDVNLLQLVAEEEEFKKAAEKLKERQAQRDDFLKLGPSDLESVTFQRFDQTRDALEASRQRIDQLRLQEKSAQQAWEDAQGEFKKRGAAKRLANEQLESNSEDSQRQNLGEEFDKAVLLAELAEAVAELRQRELTNAKQAVESQRARVDLLGETVKRLKGSVSFQAEEMAELVKSLELRKKILQNKLDTQLGTEAELQSIDRELDNARTFLNQSKQEVSQLRQRVNKAHEYGRLTILNKKKPLKDQLDRLASQQQAWQQRREVFLRRATKEQIREWTKASKALLDDLATEEEYARIKIAEIDNWLEEFEPEQAPALATSGFESTIRDWLEKQIENLRSLRLVHKDNRKSILATQKLYTSFLKEIDKDSLADTARNRLLDIWDGVGSIWNYEITSFNNQAVTVRKVVTALLILLAGIIFSKALSRALGRQVLRRLDIDPSASATIQSLFYYLLLLLFGLFSLNVAKVPLTAFTVLGGAVMLGVGFGSQNIINNFISGLILLAERPVKVGDLIQLDNLNGTTALYGNIEHIGARSTRVRTGSNLEIIVPNSSFLQNNVVNFTLSSDKVRTLVEVGVVYGSPTVTVTQLLRRAVIETGRVAKDPPPIVLFQNFGDSSLVFEVHFWIRMRSMMDQMQIQSAVRFRIDQLFREEGIVIAFPQSDVHLDTTSPLTIQMVDSSKDS